jgi:hypothetical protein
MVDWMSIALLGERILLKDLLVKTCQREWIAWLGSPKRGQANVEYAFILSLVAIGTVVLLMSLSSGTTTLLSSVNTSLDGPTTAQNSNQGQGIQNQGNQGQGNQGQGNQGNGNQSQGNQGNGNQGQGNQGNGNQGNGNQGNGNQGNGNGNGN